MSYDFSRNCQFDGSVLNRFYKETFGYKRDGRFVEVGASNGLDYSNTWGLAKIGWTGLYIEPVPALAEACRLEHLSNPKVKTICAAASDRDGRGAIWMIPAWGTATANLAAAADICARGDRQLPQPLPCDLIKLDTLLEREQWPALYDLLVIDVDFGEEAVLRGYTITRWRPKLVIIELHEQGHQPHSAPVREFAARYFAEAGYQHVYADSINTIYVLRP